MSTKKSKNKGVYFAALGLLLSGLGFLLFSGLSQNSVYFLNVSEALAMEQGDLGAVRLFGKVDERDLERDERALGVVFTLSDVEDTAKTVRVDYKGAVPDTFKPGVEVIVEGGFFTQAGTMVFGADTLMTKCPSKYKKEREEQKAGIQAS
jgi:cytochrome c-type biogenesis protein CcmE